MFPGIKHQNGKSDKINPAEDVFVVLSASFVELVTLVRAEDGKEEHVLLQLLC